MWAASRNHLKILRAKRGFPRRKSSQDCNIETLPEFPACCPAEFRLKTAVSTHTSISSLPVCPTHCPTIMWANSLNKSLFSLFCLSLFLSLLLSFPPPLPPSVPYLLSFLPSLLWILFPWKTLTNTLPKSYLHPWIAQGFICVLV